MKLQLPRKRTILAWHRWLGFAAALFLVVLSITGLILNHTERLGLNQIQVRNGLILKRYGMESGSNIQSYGIHGSNTISSLAGQLFYNATPLSTGEKPIGILEGDPITVIACPDRIIYITSNGELIESISIEQLPFPDLTALGTSPEGQPVLASTEGSFGTDSNWLEFTPYSGSYQVTALTDVELSSEAHEQLLENFQGEGVTLYRVLLDLHAGRLFGWGGRTVMDLTAIAILLLVASGIGGWLRKSRRKTRYGAAQ